jgi:alpha,alpha-trehalase
LSGDDRQAAHFSSLAWARRAAMHRYLWNADTGYFVDYSWKDARPARQLTVATLYPLFFGVASREQAQAVATAVRNQLMQPDGIATSLVRTGQQWDAPNGWAPLEWIAIKGLTDQGYAQLAEDIARRWIRENIAVYRASGKLVEKYDISGNEAARGGEYPLQDGFGWTNGVLRRLLAIYPSAAGEALAPAAALQLPTAMGAHR